jgi:hypothetical protein
MELYNNSFTFQIVYFKIFKKREEKWMITKKTKPSSSGSQERLGR